MKLEDCKAYELLKEQEIEIGSFKTKALILKHKKTGARIALLENDDENKVFYVGFRTPPMDSTGVAHILEHSVLCGSEKYPLKDPFVELVKGSLNTFLNAMTYPDKTVYPVASCNDQDFQNLIDVYLDAVFHPNIYKKKAIFLQEGWHYEMDDDGKLTYNGVVYNEMKGAFSDADEILFREMQTALYPDTSYGVESGGDPKNIPDLTYEDFLAFHSKFYHPSNSYIYLYGNMDMAEKLNYIDREYLSKYDQIEVDSEIKLQKAFDEPRRIVKDYPVDEDEDLEEKSYLSVNYSVGDNLDPAQVLAFQILDRVLCNINGAPLKTALFDAGIGSDVYSMYDNGIKQPSFSIVAKDASAEREEEFLKIVRTTLEKVVKDGLDKRALKAALNIYEFKYLEADYGRFPKGLMYGLQLLDTWLHDDLKPFVHIDANHAFAFLREQVETHYFEDLIQKYLLDNNHKAILIMNPKAGLLEENEKALADKLAKIRSEMNDADIAKIKDDTAALKAFQDREDTEEELLLLPMLKREDLGKKAAQIANEIRNVNGTEFIFHDIFTNGVGYLSIGFDLMNIPEEYFPYVGILRMMLFDVSTENYTYGDLTNEIDLYAGGMNAQTSVTNKYRNPEDCRCFFLINTKYTYNNLSKVLELIREVIFTSKYDDEKRLLEILREYKVGTQQSMISAGHSLAATRALSYDNIGTAYLDVLSKLSLYRLASDIEEHFDAKKAELTEKLMTLAKMVFRPENLRFDFTGAREELPALEAGLDALKAQLFTCDVQKGSFVPKLEKKNEGFMEPSQVNYVCRAGNYRKKGLPYDGSLRALKVMMGYEYLWMNVRVRGGAYGCMCGFATTGESYFVSYRDPNIGKTVETYQGAAEFIRNFQADERTMTKYVIGAIGELDTPMTPSAKGSFSKEAYLSGVTQEDLQKERDELLATTPEKIRKLADYVDAFMADDLFVVAGNSGKIKENEKMFGTIENLL
ncbi:MAG: insulinase family protein [Acetatifactor sp.]|nr:insulinase family protein [Acetatifactor sp.]